jgi:cytochrome oxidase Cu insertion factor (SCO1/SenC/PrrC family)
MERVFMLKKPFWILTAIILLFAIPLLLASILLYHGNLNKFLSTTNHGQLLTSPLDLANLKLYDTQAHPINPTLWKGRWLLLYINPNSTCNAICEKKIYILRQIQSATGKDQSRLQRAIITLNGQDNDPHLSQLLHSEYAGTLHFIVNASDLTYFLGNAGASKLALPQGSIYLVDPHGNVLMYYAMDADSMGIFKDITRLLKLSKIG